MESFTTAAAVGHVVLQISPVKQMVVTPKALAESEVPCAFVNEKFWREEEAVVEVAKILLVPMIGDSSPEAKVLVAVPVATNAPAVNGL